MPFIEWQRHFAAFHSLWLWIVSSVVLQKELQVSVTKIRIDIIKERRVQWNRSFAVGFVFGQNSLIFAVSIITASNSLSTSDAVLDSCNSTSFFLIDAWQTQKDLASTWWQVKCVISRKKSNWPIRCTHQLHAHGHCCLIWLILRSQSEVFSSEFARSKFSMGVFNVYFQFQVADLLFFKFQSLFR